MNWTTTFAVVVFTLSLLAFGRIRAQILYDYGRKLRITPNECQSSSPRFSNLNGVCMFNLECQEQLGTVIGACVDRFLFGACCHIPENLRKNPSNLTLTSDSSSQESTTTTYFTKSSSISTSKLPSSTEKNVISIISEISSTIASEGAHRLPPVKNNANVVISGTLNFIDSPPPTSTSTLESNPSPTKGYSTRFPSRGSADPVGSGGGEPPPRRVPSHGVKYETLGALNPSPNVLPDRERTTLPSTRDIVTLLPITLETFSSVSSPFDDSSHGGHNSLPRPNGQSHDSLEHETLSIATLENRNRHKPRPSSTRFQQKPDTSSSSSNSNDNSKQDSTEEPPKISTFMYVDENNKNKNNLKTKNNYPTTTTTPDSPIEEKTIPFQSEDLNSNTENIWSVVMQLGSQSGSSSVPTTGGDNNIPSSDSEISKIDDVASLAADQSLSSSDSFFGNTMPTVGGLMLDNSFLKIKTETTTSSLKKKPANTGDDQNNNDSATEQDSGIENDNDDNSNDKLFNNNNKKTTAKPWASSTYHVHTFTYPNNFPSENDDDDEFESSTATISNNNKNPMQSTTLPSIGKITTWSGIGSVVEKEDLINKHSDEDEEDDEDSKPSGTLLTTMLITRTTPGSNSSTTTTTTQKPSTTTTTERVVTKRPTTRYTTRRTTTKATTTTTTTEKPTTAVKKVVTDKWKKPKPYTLPPHKRPTTTEPTPKTEPTTRRTTTTTSTTTTKKPKTKAPVVKDKKPANVDKSPTILFDEDVDTRLDDFVDQVVQGIAGTLDNLNLDDVIFPGNTFPASDISADATIDPLQVISDPLFPPFPLLGEVPLTKPNVKSHMQEKKQVTTTTTSTTTQKPLDWRKDCGVRTLPKSGRIVGGTASKFGKWPWQALVKEATWLGLFSKNKCGGVLIAPKYVLTAAHCQPGFLATLTVVLGDFDISSTTEAQANSITKNVRRVIVHRDYNAQTFENDIALLELDSAVDFASHIVPICLPTDEEEFIGRSAYVTGWGRLKYGGGVPQILHEVDVPILKNDECQDMFHKSGHLKAIRDSFICAGWKDGQKDSCEGDSGGPLSIQRTTGQWVLAGTVSHGIKCAYPNLPGVYMRMTFYKPWIKRVTGIK